MAKDFQVKVTGLDDAIKNLRKVGPAMTDAAAEMLYNFGQTQIEAPAKIKFVPVVTGNLRSTITTSRPDIRGTRIRVVVSAGGPAAKYARRVHENPRAGKTGGVSPSGKRYYPRPGLPVPWSKVGQWKYLETPAIEAARNGAAWLKRESSLIIRRVRRLLKPVK